MAQYPALPLWTDAYLADTTHLTTIEHGAYMLLLVTMWRAGGTLPNDDKQLARFTRLTAGQWARIKPTIMAFFRVSSDSITQGRLTDELVFVRQRSRKQSNNSNARWLKNNDLDDAMALPNNPSGNANSMPDECPHTHTHLEEDKSSSLMSEKGSEESDKGRAKSRPKPKYPEPFEAFWRAYPTTPNMSKAKTLEAWSRLDADDRTTVEVAVPRYRAFLETKRDHPVMHATTFINERRFDGYAESASSSPKPEADWLKRLTFARDRKQWHVENWGPMPHQTGSQVPENLLQPDDGQGWAVWEA